MARRVIGIDLGSYSVKLVRLLCGKQPRRFEVVDVAEEILSTDDADKDLISRQRDAVLRLQARGLLDAETMASGISATQGQMLTMRVPFLEHRKVEAVLPGLLESEVPFEIDGMVYAWHRAEESQPSKMPEGESGSNIAIGFGKREDIAKALQVLQSASIDPRLMHLASVAPFELIRELGAEAFLEGASLIEGKDSALPSLSAIIDLGHRATSICIFDRLGVKHTRTFLRGGEKLSEDIASALQISLADAQAVKHEGLDLALGEGGGDPISDKVNGIGLSYFKALFDDIHRTFITLKTTGLGEVGSIAFIGGGAMTKGLMPMSEEFFKTRNIYLLPAQAFLPVGALDPRLGLALAYALSCLQIHVRASRFNFRKDEFIWRGGLSFVKNKSVSLVLWGLIAVCSLVVMWSALAMILDKEDKHLKSRLAAQCSAIIGQKDVGSGKCLATMKEQIAAGIDVGIPAYSASDVYINLAKFLPKELNVTISELDVSEKKIRIAGTVENFEEVDKVVGHLSKIPCLINWEKGRAQQTDNLVKFNLSSDLDCQAVSPAKDSNGARM